MGEAEERGTEDLSVIFRDLGPEEIDDYIDFDAPISWGFLTEEERESLSYDGYLRVHRELIRSLYESNIKNRIIAAYIDGSIVGVVWIGMKLDTVHYVPVCYIYDIEVKEELRGKGLGSKLLHMAEETCREWGLSEVMLSVEASNSEALKWYERRGYEVKRLLLSKSSST
ncbi:MAG: GNAT family N-acetyltransferase [Candidatus Korarchaeum sp.]|nr:GNAT family N-acetyltransferase [Candidatus Korarchaeum sp.]MDW8035909.1 GNAT family N-acetyltransferase [Candidatus Korarchaeum sp.]